MPTRPPTLPFLRPRTPFQEQTPEASPLSPPSSSSTWSSSSSSTSTPSTPLSPAPKTPYPWIWKCHLCDSIYRLGVTRRCLFDGHFFCSVPTPPPSPSWADSLGLGGFGGNGAKKMKKRKRKVKRGCRAEFDYSGWEGYNCWRREVEVRSGCCDGSGNEENRKGRGVRDVGRMNEWGVGFSGRGGRMRKDCFRECDFPSQCLNEGLKEREDRLKECERARECETGDASELVGGDEDIIDPELETGFYDAENCNCEKEGVVELSPGDVGDSDALKAAIDPNLGPLGTDCDGLGEESNQFCYVASRRKSFDAMAEGEPPKSPLKECAFGFDDVELGCGERDHESRDWKMDEVEGK